MKLRSLVCIVAISVAAAACGESPDIEQDNGVAMNEPIADETADQPAGTTGMAEEPAGAPDQAPGASGADRQDAAALPDTASPLGLAALIGLLSLGSAAGIRFLQR